ncbi:MAG: hypothetical protein PHW40_00370 [Candidatus Izemoplasmatales bacterium]|nr:hypothetical protein [Candidatus Izemoplasmatales bacterium]
MKKLLLLVVGLLATFTLLGCVSDEVLASATKDYYVAGQAVAWDTVPAGKMTAIARSDERIKSIVSKTRGATALYLLEVTFPATEAGWTITYKINGTVTTFDGNLSVKIIRNAKDDTLSRDWWAQSPESGLIKNLSPKTLYIPPFVEDNVDQAGTWNDNPVVLEPGTYYIVFAEFEGSKGLAAVPKP